jgi:hypothetical protein
VQAHERDLDHVLLEKILHRTLLQDFELKTVMPKSDAHAPLSLWKTENASTA